MSEFVEIFSQGVGAGLALGFAVSSVGYAIRMLVDIISLVSK